MKMKMKMKKITPLKQCQQELNPCIGLEVSQATIHVRKSKKNKQVGSWVCILWIISWRKRNKREEWMGNKHVMFWAILKEMKKLEWQHKGYKLTSVSETH